MATSMQKLQEKYDHALDSLWALFKIGREREQMLEDELTRIKVICNQAKDSPSSKSVYLDEIKGICERGLSS